MGPLPCYGFWRTPEIQAPFPWRGVRVSGFLHAALLGLLYAISIWPATQVHLADSHLQRAMSVVQLSPYLPELHGAPSHHTAGGKADPVIARQEIRSFPDVFDNLHQTIVTPPDIKLKDDLQLPNLVAYEQAPPAPPLDTSARSAVVQLQAMLPQMAQRAPVIVQLKPQRAVPHSPAGVAQPAPEVSPALQAPNLAALMPPVANPALPVPRTPQIVQLKPQRAPSAVQQELAQPAPELNATARGSAPNLAQLIPQRAESALPAAAVADGRTPQVVALSAHPADVQDLAVPDGNRAGAFAASPSGGSNATGAPGAGGASGVGPRELPGKVNAPPGISVGAPPSTAAAVASPKAPAPKAASPNPSATESDTRKKLLAAARPPAIASVRPPAPMAHETTSNLTELENHIFAGRRSYTLMVNMPNLNVAIGSWIIRFVDRKQGLVPEPITAPEVLRKTDPAYPSEVFVHGVVILTAIIRADGTVSDIAVAQGLFPQLDQNAVEALSRWIFRPALKNGEPIDLEAVITVPFRTR